MYERNPHVQFNFQSLLSNDSVRCHLSKMKCCVNRPHKIRASRTEAEFMNVQFR
jgi:hypothetical protein